MTRDPAEVGAARADAGSSFSTHTLDGMTIRVFADRAAAISCAADRVSDALIRPSVLALPTGRTPIDLYRELCSRHARGAISFTRTETFNLDEYWPIVADAPGSFRRFMREHLFAHVDLAPERTHVPNGAVTREAIESECRSYEAAIARVGGLDLAILGIGRNGHIGFNEPGSPPTSRTRLVELTDDTRRANAADFPSADAVPRHALTMGIGTILSARRIVVLAFGESKAAIVERAMTSAIDDSCPASHLRHVSSRVEWLLDAASADRIRRSLR